MVRKAIVGVVACAALLGSSSVASAGWYLPVQRGKSAIKSELRLWQAGSRYAMKVSACYKPQGDRVRCFFQTREIMDGYWLQCYGTANARERYGWTQVTLSRGWLKDCYYTDDPSFL
jgi:hypothetical protein